MDVLGISGWWQQGTHGSMESLGVWLQDVTLDLRLCHHRHPGSNFGMEQKIRGWAADASSDLWCYLVTFGVTWWVAEKLFEGRLPKPVL